jgi:hypothetical protein
VPTNPPTSTARPGSIQPAPPVANERSPAELYRGLNSPSPPRPQFSVLPPLFRHTGAVVFSFDQVSSSHRNAPGPDDDDTQFQTSKPVENRGLGCSAGRFADIYRRS